MSDLERVKLELEQFLEGIDGKDTTEFVSDLCEFAAKIGDDVGEALLDAHPELLAYAARLKPRFDEFLIQRDIAEVRRIQGLDLDAPISFRDIASKPSVNAYDRVNEMFDHVDFRECRRVVMVGCGRRPFTMFHIHDKTDVPEIVGLDIVPEALEVGEALAGRLGYDRACFVLCDGIAYDFGGADLVYVSAMVSPKAAVVSRIVDTAPGHVHITVREPYALGRLWSESAVRPLDPRLEIAGSGSGAWSLSRDVHLKRRP